MHTDFVTRGPLSDFQPRSSRPHWQRTDASKRLPSASPSGVEYPSPVPSLPAPAVPIREIPTPEAVKRMSRSRVNLLESTDALERPEARAAALAKSAEYRTVETERFARDSALVQANHPKRVVQIDHDLAGQIIDTEA